MGVVPCACWLLVFEWSSEEERGWKSSMNNCRFITEGRGKGRG
jgi:hypothetical protein